MTNNNEYLCVNGQPVLWVEILDPTLTWLRLIKCIVDDDSSYVINADTGECLVYPEQWGGTINFVEDVSMDWVFVRYRFRSMPNGQHAWYSPLGTTEIHCFNDGSGVQWLFIMSGVMNLADWAPSHMSAVYWSWQDKNRVLILPVWSSIPQNRNTNLKLWTPLSMMRFLNDDDVGFIPIENDGEKTRFMGVYFRWGPNGRTTRIFNLDDPNNPLMYGSKYVVNLMFSTTEVLIITDDGATVSITKQHPNFSRNNIVTNVFWSFYTTYPNNRTRYIGESSHEVFHFRGKPVHIMTNLVLFWTNFIHIKIDDGDFYIDPTTQEEINFPDLELIKILWISHLDEVYMARRGSQICVYPQDSKSIDQPLIVWDDGMDVEEMEKMFNGSSYIRIAWLGEFIRSSSNDRWMSIDTRSRNLSPWILDSKNITRINKSDLGSWITEFTIQFGDWSSRNIYISWTGERITYTGMDITNLKVFWEYTVITVWIRKYIVYSSSYDTLLFACDAKSEIKTVRKWSDRFIITNDDHLVSTWSWNLIENIDRIVGGVLIGT